MEDKRLERILTQMRLLTHALMISVALNIGLLASFVYKSLYETSPQLAFEPVDLDAYAGEKPLIDTLTLLWDKDPHQLFLALKQKNTLSMGFATRDVALAILVERHHFDLTRALHGLSLPKRPFTWRDFHVNFFPDLGDSHFVRIIDFCTYERWPYDTEGLFAILRMKREDSLDLAFTLTQEFRAIDALFNFDGANVEKKDLLSLLVEAPFDVFSTFAQEQMLANRLDKERRRVFLQQYLARGSQRAAELFCILDLEYLHKKAPEEELKKIHKLLPLAKMPQFLAEKFAPQVVVKPVEAIAPQVIPKEPSLPPAKASLEHKKEPPSVKIIALYTVNRGDTLKRIAGIFGSDPLAIKKVNGLKSDVLTPGMDLKIPGKTKTH